MSRVHVPVAPQPWRTLATCACFAAAFTVLVVRLHQLQLVDRAELVGLGERQRQLVIALPAERGAIYAADGTPLVVTTATWDLIADTGYMDDKLRATVALADLLGMPREELRAHFDTGRNGRTIARHLGEELRLAIDALDIAHIYLRPSHQRQYLHGRLASHVLGFVGADGTGGGGIEYGMDGVLRGHGGEERFQADARRRAIVGRGYRRIDPKPGAHVHLTLVPAIQAELEAAVREAGVAHHAVGVCGIALRPATGEILGMASWPDFDPADPGAVAAELRRDRNLSFIFEPGSTMKPLVAGACVQEGIVRWDTSLDCEQGRWKCRYRRKAITSHPHGVLPVSTVVAKSDNIGMAKLFLGLAERHGVGHAYEWMTRLGFGATTGLALPGEQYGILPRVDRWTMGTVITASFGHGVSVTPIQMACAHAAVANGGVWLPPRLVERIERRAEGGAIRSERPDDAIEPRRIFDPAVADGIEASMVEVMTEGTGSRLRLDGYSSAGKTGTTDVLVNGRYLESGGPHIGSFVGWAPAVPGEAAEILVYVVVDQPRRADGSPAGHPDYFGSATAGPVVQRVLQNSLAVLGVRPDLAGP